MDTDTDDRDDLDNAAGSRDEVLTPRERDDLKQMFTEWDRDLDGHWSAWRKEARECFDIVAGRSWSRYERVEMQDAKRVPVEFNRTLPLVKAVAGAEISGRLRVDYKPRTMGDSLTNEMLTSGAEWIRDECDAAGEESQAFFNTLVCGLGFTETRLDFEIDPEGRVIEDCIDSLEVDIDPSARKACASDRKYMRRRRTFTPREAKERFGDDVTGSDDNHAGESVDDPRNAYSDDTERSKRNRDEVVIKEYQWYELRKEFVVMNPADGTTISVEQADFRKLQKAAKQAGRAFQHLERRVRVYRRAFVADTRILEVEDLPSKAFTINVITGDYDRNEGTWFGLVRPMRDPQKWANKFFSLIIHIVATNAKGGVLAEEDAIEDIDEFEETWAAGDSVSIVRAGGLNKIKEKPKAQYPAGIDRMMETAQTAIRDVAGVSPEFLGQADRMQAGTLEHQRKQAAYGIMAGFFDSQRRFRKEQGRLMLTLMAYLPKGTLIRVTMDDWENPKYVPMEALALDPETMKFDVIVSEAPSGPNQKERTFQVILQILPAVKDMMTPELWLEVLRFSPLPDAFVQKVKAAFAQAQEAPEQVLQKQIAMEGGKLKLRGEATKIAGEEARNANTAADTAQKQLETFLSMMNPDPRPQMVM